MSPDSLVGISKSAHTTHNSQHVIVRRIDPHLGRLAAAHRVVGQSQHQRGVVNTGHVAAAAGLVVLGVQGERVHVDAHRGDVGVVLEGLHQVEVLALTLRETVMAVQLHLGHHRGVLAGQTLHSRDGVARLQRRAVKPVRVVERLLALPLVHAAVAGHERIALHHPDQLLARVVEGHLDLVGAGGHRLVAGELQLLNQILVGHLGEPAALLSVQVDVVHVQRRGHQTGGVHTGQDGRLVGPAQVAKFVELQVDLHLVVLEGDQRQRQTRMAVEPELQGHVQGVLGRAAAGLRAGVGLTAGAVIVAATIGAHLGQGVHQLGHVAHHLGVTGLLARGAGQLIPDVQPVTVVLVDALTADLDLYVADQIVAHPVQPAELRTGAIGRLQLHLRQRGLQIGAVDQVAVAADGAGHTLAEVGHAVEGLLNRLHREVGVPAIELLEKGHLGVRRQIHILGAVGHELHQTTGHLSAYTPAVENILEEDERNHG